MSQRSRQASPGQSALGILLVTVGLGSLVAKLELPELWILALKNAAQLWWPVMLIVAGIIWWIAHRRQTTSGVPSERAHTSWEARHGI
jgi:hypothetical protein